MPRNLLRESPSVDIVTSVRIVCFIKVAAFNMLCETVGIVSLCRKMSLRKFVSHQSFCRYCTHIEFDFEVCLQIAETYLEHLVIFKSII